MRELVDILHSAIEVTESLLYSITVAPRTKLHQLMVANEIVRKATMQWDQSKVPE